MAQQIKAEMSTDVALNTLKASQSLKSLNAVISSTKNAWKSQEVALKSTGEYLKAAEVRYKGLGDSIKAQEAKIESLREKQKGLDVTTKDGANSYLKYQKDIDSATTQLKSMEAQQTRAKTSLEYQKSGLASLQTEYKQITTVSSSYVERLKAEGKQQEANKAQMTGYKDSISNLNKQLVAQEKELERVATASGKDSSAYKTQVTRVNETATALAKTKTSMSELDGEMKKANPSVFSRIKSAIEGTNKQAEKTPSLFKKIVAGGLVTNAISNGFSSLTSAMKTTISSGLDLAEAGEKSAAAWSAMGKSASDVKSLGSQVSDLNTKSGLTIATIGGMQKTIDTMTHGNTQMTENITAGVTAIGTASRMSGDQISALSKSMTRVVASGSLTSTALARMEKQAPALGAQLAKAAGVSQDAFAKMVASGKV
ncbi:tape measure protein [Lacticaseibacillus salsurivasis]|uniref:tape measure protein n=1 Tax=Lacticaseibacillus salsurivasis TaxID=3081441 RepID=UPI0030C74A7A